MLGCLISRLRIDQTKREYLLNLLDKGYETNQQEKENLFQKLPFKPCNFSYRCTRNKAMSL